MSILPRPYICRLTSLSLVTCPSVWPLDQGSTMAARTAASSSRTPEAKDAISLSTASRSQGVRTSVFLAATMVLKRSSRLRAATIFGEAVSTATLMRNASADLQSRSDVSRRATVRAGGTVVTASDWPEDACVARRLRVAHSVTIRWLPPYPASRRRRQSSAPFRQPASQLACSRFTHRSSVVSRDRNTSLRVAARMRRTVWRDTPVVLTMPLMLLPLVVQGSDGPVHLFARLPSGPLSLFGRAERIGIDIAPCDGLTKIAHVPLRALDEGGHGVLQQMPAVGDLYGLGSALGGPFAIAAAAVAADDLDAGMGGKSARNGATLPIRQEIDGAATLEIADDRPVALTFLPSEIVDADDTNIGRPRCRAPAQEAQQRVGAHQHGEASGDSFSGTAAEGKGDRVGEDVEARRAACVHPDAIRGEAFREYLALAGGVAASEPTGRQTDPEPSAMGWKIAQ